MLCLAYMFNLVCLNNGAADLLSIKVNVNAESQAQ